MIIIIIRIKGRGPGSPLYFYTKLRPEGMKIFFGDRPPSHLRVWMTAPPPLSEDLDPALKYMAFWLNWVRGEQGGGGVKRTFQPLSNVEQ